jgi:hypothetical protein
MRHSTGSRTVTFLSVVLLIGAALGGCNVSAREMMEREFALDPPVVVEYQQDGSRLYKTRNIVLIADFAKSQMSSLVMLVALSGEPTRDDSAGQIGGLVKFRSIDNVPHFENNRDRVISLGGQRHELGPCAYEQDSIPRGGRVENLTAILPQDLIKEMAAADNVQGLIGVVPFELSGEQLIPVRALVDTVGVR